MDTLADQAYQTQSAVLLVIFNRPDTTAKVFEEIRIARPPRLYVAADGPRQHKPYEADLCAEARMIVHKVDWPCQVFTLFRHNNMGCKNAVSGAIDWFFEHEEEGIVLEDDCLPNNDFFLFCDTMLAHYRHDGRIRHICGCNFQRGQQRGAASYYFSNLTHIWGWAGWRRVWKDYDKDLKRYYAEKVRSILPNIFSEPMVVDAWLQIFNELKAGNIDTWDYQLTFINFFNNSLSIIPNQNLISNIGFRADGTHTVAADNPNAALPVSALKTPISHPLYIVPNKEADQFTLDNDFSITEKKQKENKLSRRIKRALKGG